MNFSLDQASRPIMWNVEALPNTILMYALLGVALVVFSVGLLRHVEMWLAGEGKHRPDSTLVERIEALLAHGLFQHGTVRDKRAAWGHSLIYLGFLVLLFTTTMVLIDHDFGIDIYEGRFYLGVTLLSDIFGLGVLFGCGILAYRRYVEQPDHLHNRGADSWALAIIALLCVQGFLLEGLRIKVTGDPWAMYSPVGNAVAGFFWGISEPVARGIHFVTWWFHTLTVFVTLAMLPYTKFFHILASSANLFFKDRVRPLGALSSPGDIEKLIEEGDEFNLGLGSIKDYSWKQLLDLDACTSCGRCQEVCPAYLSGKPLSPKWMILDTRNHALGLLSQGKLSEKSVVPNALKGLDSKLAENYIVSTSGVRKAEDGYTVEGDFRGANELVQTNVRSLAKNVDDRVAGDVLDPDVFWSCNTCNACVEACPVGINHVDQIVGNRRNMVLMQGEMPSEAQQTLRALETRQNPYGAPEDRFNWAEGLEVPVVQAGDKVDYLYWVGCVSAYDQRKQKIARSMVKVLNASGVSWGTLGTAEGCTGDPARRIGEENLFQSLAKSNIETLKSITFKTLVANCPHCFNTIKNEYPQFGNLGNGQSPEIIHHSVLLKQFLAEGKVALEEGTEEKVTYHDPCYLGRYNDEYDAPRETLKKTNSKLKILEMDKSREKGMCCGAGGGHFWYDMKVGDRVNVLRVEQAAETKADTIAAACPFCMQMLEDGIKLTEREESLKVRDLAEFVAENMSDN